MDYLPNEMIMNILSFLSVSELGVVSKNAFKCISFECCLETNCFA